MVVFEVRQNDVGVERSASDSEEDGGESNCDPFRCAGDDGEEGNRVTPAAGDRERASHGGPGDDLFGEGQLHLEEGEIAQP